MELQKDLGKRNPTYKVEFTHRDTRRSRDFRFKSS
jgi:hypothetical protein